MSERNQQFDNFDEWVSRASSWLTRRGPFVRAACFDAKGRMCQRGTDMGRARDENAFPVWWIWPGQNINTEGALRWRDALESIAYMSMDCPAAFGPMMTAEFYKRRAYDAIGKAADAIRIVESVSKDT